MSENFAVLTHRKTVMGRRVQRIATHLTDLIPCEVVTLLDVGAGTGEMAQAIGCFRPELKISGVDVYLRPKTFIPVVKFDGERLPFDSDSIDAVMTIDVLHHCENPVAVLRECVRVSKKWVIIKDHISNSLFDHAVLGFMDWVGNRAHGVVLPYNYLSSSAWDAAFAEVGLCRVTQLNDLHLYPMPFDLVFGGSLHCLHLLEKKQNV